MFAGELVPLKKFFDERCINCAYTVDDSGIPLTSQCDNCGKRTCDRGGCSAECKHCGMRLCASGGGVHGDWACSDPYGYPDPANPHECKR